MLNKIISVIQQSEKDSISFSEYMGLVLYDENEGYYMKDRKKIGKEGDFYTNSNVHSVFGKVLARIFIHLVQKGVFPPTICEIGAGTGRLAHFILEEWKQLDPQTFEQLHYFIIEMSPYHRKEQLSIIENIDKVQQFSSIAELVNKTGDYTGVILSNELFDAFPVDVLQKKDNVIYEVRIAVDDGKLVETFVPCDNTELIQWLIDNKIVLENGQRIEIPVAMNKWLEQTANWFEKGIMFTIDYGYTKDEWMEPVHRDGSLRGYYKHQMIANPLLHPGDMDLTTHIHLDAFVDKANEVDLKLLAMLKQYQFLIRGGILDYLQENYDPNPFSEISKQNRAIRTLISDYGISAGFTVLIQQKNLENLTVNDVLIHDL